MTWPVSQHSPKPGEWQWQFKNSTGQSMLRWWTFAISFSQASQSVILLERQTCRGTHSHPQPKEENKINLAKSVEQNHERTCCSAMLLSSTFCSRAGRYQRADPALKKQQAAQMPAMTSRPIWCRIPIYLVATCDMLVGLGVLLCTGDFSAWLHTLASFQAWKTSQKITGLWSISTLSFASFSLSLRAKAEKLCD